MFFWRHSVFSSISTDLLLNSRHLLISGCMLTFFTVGCGKSENNNAATPITECIKQDTTQWAGFAFIGTDLKYTSSSLAFCDFATGSTRSLLTGEAGDAGMYWINQKLYFFNRSSSSFNFRTLDPRNTQDAASPQIAMVAGTPGDPAGAIAVSTNKILLGLGISGELAVIDSATGVVDTAAVATDLVSQLDLVPASGGDAATFPFRPSSFLSFSKESKSYIAVTHLGLDANYSATTTAQIFILEKSDSGVLTIVDQDPSREKHQGLKLSFSNPSSFIPTSNSGHEYALLSLCNSTTECKQGIEIFNTSDQTITTTWDLSGEPFINNGTVKAKPDGQFIYAGVQFISGENSGKKSIIALNLKEKTWAVIHHFPAESSGCCGNALYISDSKTLLVSDEKTDGTGIFSVYDVSSTAPLLTNTLTTSSVPRGSLLIPAQSTQ